ncbi:hypothetical protein JXA63_04090 [Candidatus Woesebacteria bacterium]|nr:hypothetical protein [Candidatus Woesebacteria bacterium]
MTEHEGLYQEPWGGRGGGSGNRNNENTAPPQNLSRREKRLLEQIQKDQEEMAELQAKAEANLSGNYPEAFGKIHVSAEANLSKKELKKRIKEADIVKLEVGVGQKKRFLSFLSGFGKKKELLVTCNPPDNEEETKRKKVLFSTGGKAVGPNLKIVHYDKKVEELQQFYPKLSPDEIVMVAPNPDVIREGGILQTLKKFLHPKKRQKFAYVLDDNTVESYYSGDEMRKTLESWAEDNNFVPASRPRGFDPISGDASVKNLSKTRSFRRN